MEQNFFLVHEKKNRVVQIFFLVHEKKYRVGKNFKIVKRSCSLNRYYRVGESCKIKGVQNIEYDFIKIILSLCWVAMVVGGRLRVRIPMVETIGSLKGCFFPPLDFKTFLGTCKKLKIIQCNYIKLLIPLWQAMADGGRL